jgi:parvulin-like peptidyl-prolyl isomerase
MTGRITALFLLFGSGCATTSTAYLARVNEEVITGRELRAEFERHHAAMEKILGDEPEVRKYLERLVDRRLFVQEGYSLGLQETPEVREAVTRFRNQKLVETYLKEHVDAQVKVSDDEVKAANALMVEQAVVLQIVVATRSEAEAVAASLKKGADFETLAREKSIAESSKRGGLIRVGWGADEELEAALAGLKEGEVSAPFHARGGWEVVRLEKRHAVEPPPYDKVAPKIRSVLLQRRRTAVEQALYAPLWAKYGATVIDCAPTTDDLKKAATARATTVCATWQGGTITVDALARRVKLDQLGALGGSWPEVRQAVVEDLVARELVLREAEADGLAKRPEIVQKVQTYQDDQVEGRLYRDQVIRDVKASDADVRTFFDTHPELYVEDARYELAHVMVATREEAKVVEDQVKKARQPFAEVAKAYSKDEKTAASGGRIGLMDRKSLVNELAPLARLGEGEVSEPIATSAGFHVVKVLSIKPARPIPFDDVASDARKRALEELQAAEVKRWIAQLRAAARIEINDAGIRAYSRERTLLLAKEQAERATIAKEVAAKDAATKAAAEKVAAEKAATEKAAEPMPAPPTPPAAATPPARPAP